ncbi:MAG: hypothetical protein ABFD92_10895 [Planctomycetaceae bacterium]
MPQRNKSMGETPVPQRNKSMGETPMRLTGETPVLWNNKVSRNQ